MVKWLLDWCLIYAERWLTCCAEPIYTLGVEFVSGSYTNLTSRCLQGQVERQLATLFEPPREGHAMFTLVNEDGWFSPQNSASPYYPNVVPGKNVKLEATHSSSTYALFKGRVVNYQLSPALGERTALLEAADSINKLVNTFVTTSLYTNTNPQSLFTALMSEARVNSFATDTIRDSVLYAWYHDEAVVGAMAQLTEFGSYRLYEDGAGTIRLKDRTWNQGASSVATYAADGTGFDTLDLSFSQDSVINKAKVEGQPRKQSTTVNTVAWLQEVLVVPSSGHLGFWLNYVDPDEPPISAPAVNLVAPVSSTDWKLGSSSGSLLADLTGTGSLNITLFGESAVCSLFNGTGAPAFVNQFQIRGNSVQAQPAVAAEMVSDSSQTVYGKREFTLTNDLMHNYLFLNTYADFIVTTRKEPLSKVGFSLKNEWPDVLAREVGDIVSLVESVSAINSQWMITGVSHDIALSGGLEHALTCTVEPHPDYQWLVLDDPVRGKLDDVWKLGL